MSSSSSPVSNVRANAITARDILCSFDPEKLPDELLREGLFENIDFEYGHGRGRHEQPPADRTITLDLVGTLFQHAAHDSRFFRELRKIQSESTCQRLFYEKVDRRVRYAFDRYDHLRNIVAGGNRLSEAQDREMYEIPTYLRSTLAAVLQDLQNRQYPTTHEKAANTALTALEGVCERNEDVILIRQMRNQPRRAINLFELLIGIPNNFGVDILEELEDGILRINHLKPQFMTVHGKLMANVAPREYLRRFSQLQ